MKQPANHHRRSIRLPEYDYAQPGAYFITVCTHQRACLFGEIVDGEIRLSEMGHMVRDKWKKTQQIRSEIELDQFVIMPNHFHAIIWIHDGRGTARRAPTGEPTYEQFGKPVAGSIPTIVRAFKSAVTRQINFHRNTPGMPVWQRNYYEHIIRNEAELNAVRDYIANNPQQWALDADFVPG